MTIFLEDSLLSLPCLQRGLLALVLEKDPEPSITVQGRLHCPNSVLMESVATLASAVFHTATKKKPPCVVFASALLLAPSSVLVVLPLAGSGSSEGHRPCSLVSLPHSWAPPGSFVMLLRNSHGVDVL